MAGAQGINDAARRLEEPVAIIGMACRYPGEGSSPAGFWDMISNGRTAHSSIPASRFNADAWYHPDPDRKGAIGVKSGFFLDEDISLFDAPFFSMTAREANTMDPMHRWILEVAYESLENAGIPMNSLPGSDTGCYVGCFTRDYSEVSTTDIFDTGPYVATGTGLTMLSNRVSWFFDLQGPSMSIDTACSSSMYALHLACQAIRTGEIKQAIVGGTNLLLNPDLFHSLSKMHMMSPDGKCHSFDDRANGYARGEAIAALVVKSLSAAIADGDTIRAVIRGTGCNQDGRTPGITMPSAQAQANLIRSTYAKARVPLSETAYFEAHGTGTSLGDPLELSALGTTFGAARSSDQAPLYVSSVKTNIGHTEGCSALAGIMKAVMSIEKGLIAPNAEFENLNPKLRLDDWKLALPPKTITWPTNGVRRVSVNSFGYGGANGHVILQDAASYLKGQNITGNHMTLPLSSDTDDDSGFSGSATSEDEGQSHAVSASKIFTFSSFDQAGLQRIGSSWTQFLTDRLDQAKLNNVGIDTNLEAYTADLAYTLGSRRTIFDCRSFAIASSLTELRSKVEDGLPKVRRAVKNDNIIMIFTGQGAQWQQMGIELIGHPVFLNSIKKTQSILNTLQCPWDALEELKKSKEDSRINDAEISQPMCTALQVALVDLMTYWGIKARGVVGHSSGEIGAAYAAQCISHEDAMKVAYLRGIYSASVGPRLTNTTGAMMAAGLSEEEAVPYLDRVTTGKAVVACINSPSSVTLSGDKPAIAELEEMLKTDNKFARALKVSTAYHSHHMLVIAEEYLNAMGTLQIQTPARDAPFMFSSVTTRLVKPQELDAAYWVKNMVSPVRFADAVKALISHSPSVRGRRRAIVSYSAMIEVGPHEALKGPLNQILGKIDNNLNSTITYASLLSRGQRGDVTALNCIGKLWSQGVTVNLQRVNLQEQRHSRPKVLGDLPSYPWNHTKGFWHESEISKAKRFKKAPRNDLLGMAVDVQNPHHPRWRQFLSIHEQPWLEHHKITNTILLPGAGMLIMALEAAHEVADKDKKVKGVEFRDVTFDRGLVIPENPDQAVETSLEFQPHKLNNEVVAGWYRFTVFSLPPNGEWVEHCSGLVSPVYEGSQEVDSGTESAAEWKQQTEEYVAICASSKKSLDKTKFYQNLDDIGMGYGDLFRNLENAYAGSECGHGTIVIPDTKASMPFEYEFPHFIHPTTLDAIFHLLFVGLHSGEPMADAAVPVTMESMFIAAELPTGAGAKYKGYTYGQKTTAREGAGSIIVSDEAWSSPKIVIRNFAARNVTGADTILELTSQRKLFTQIRWMEDVDHFKGPTAQAILQASGSPHTQLLSWLERLCHQRSDLSVLVLGQQESKDRLDIVRRFAPRVGSRGRFDQCLVLETSKTLLEETRRELEKDDIIAAFKAVDLQQTPAEKALAPASFDLVVANKHDGRSLSELASLVRPRGWMVFDQLSEITLLPDLSATLTLESMPSNGQSITIASIPAKQDSQSLPQAIMLLEPDEPSAELEVLKQNLVEILRSRNIKVAVTPLSGAEQLKNQTIISLVEADQPAIINFNEEQLEQFKKVCINNPYMLWISRSGLQFGPSTGLLRVVRTETPQIRLPHLEISLGLPTTSEKLTSLIVDIFESTVREDDVEFDMEYTEKNGQIFIPRLTTDASFDNEVDIGGENPTAIFAPLGEAGRPLRMSVITPGNPDSFLWVDDNEALGELGEEDVEIQVTCAPLNTADIADLMGDNLASAVGREASGVVTRVGNNVLNFKAGQHVVTILTGSCRTMIRQKQDLVATAADGLTSPLSAVAAYYALDLAHMVKGEKLLIHTAAGALGQAAIQIAQNRGVEVFVTVGSNAKKQLLCDMYNIPEDHVLSSRDLTFAKGIKRLTNGEGVDVVLNTLVGEGFRETWSCVAEFGRFIDLGLKFGNAAIDTGRQITYSKLNLEQLISKRRALVAEALDKVCQLATSGVLSRTSPVNKFSVSDAKQAFALLQSGDYSGKIVLEFDSQARVPMMPAKPIPLQLDPTATYLIPGGLGGLGPGIVSTMIDCGAKHVVTMSRSGAKTERQIACVRGWQERGCRVDALRCDCTDLSQLEALMEQSRSESWNIRGVVQLAMVLRDSPFETMTFDKWQTAVRPKVEGTWNLHNLLPKDLDFFITLSSISNIIGNAGQANYCAGNAYQDAICQHRTSLGLKGTSINVGLMSDTDEYATNEEWSDFLQKNPHFGPLQLKERDFLVALTACMKGHTSNGTPVPANIITGMSDDLERGRNNAPLTAIWATDRKFELRQKPSCERSARSSDRTGTNRPNTAAQLEAATTLADATAAVEFALRCNVAGAMTADPEDIDPEKPLHAFGVDSLKAVEVRNWVFREIKTEVSVFDILSHLSIAKLAVRMVANCRLVKEEVARAARESACLE